MVGTSSVAHALYYFLISNFSDAVALQRSVWSLNLEVAITVIVTFTVRCFFTVRLWTMSNKNKILATAISIFSLAQLGLGLGMSVITFLVMRFEALPNYLLEISLQLSCAVFADILTTTALVYYLNRSRTGLQSTDSVINKLILWSVNTALITGIIEVLVLVLWVSMTDRLVFLAFHLVVGKLYTNSLLAMLNGREYLATNNNNSRPWSRDTASVIITTNIRPSEVTASIDGHSLSEMKKLPKTAQPHHRGNSSTWSEPTDDKDDDSLRFAAVDAESYAEILEE